MAGTGSVLVYDNRVFRHQDQEGIEGEGVAETTGFLFVERRSRRLKDAIITVHSGDGMRRNHRDLGLSSATQNGVGQSVSGYCRGMLAGQRTFGCWSTVVVVA